MSAYQELLRLAALLTVLMPCIPSAALASAYLVCYLPADTAKHVVRFCPGAPDAVAGEPCQCLQRAATLVGTMTVLTLPDAGAQEAPQNVCLPRAHAPAAVTLCTAFRPTGDGGCACEGGAGESYAVSMIPRLPLRTNQAAAADFLRRLQECCLSK